MYNHWLHAVCILLLGGFLLISCKKECKPTTSDPKIMTKYLLGKWEVVEYINLEGENIKDNIGDKFKFSCKECQEYSEDEYYCIEGKLTISKTAFRKYKATWSYAKNYLIVVRSEEDNFPYPEMMYEIIKISQNELEIGNSYNYIPKITLKK